MEYPQQPNVGRKNLPQKLWLEMLRSARRQAPKMLREGSLYPNEVEALHATSLGLSKAPDEELRRISFYQKFASFFGYNPAPPNIKPWQEGYETSDARILVLLRFGFQYPSW